MTARRRVVRTREPCSGAVDGVDVPLARPLTGFEYVLLQALLR